MSDNNANNPINDEILHDRIKRDDTSYYHPFEDDTFDAIGRAHTDQAKQCPCAMIPASNKCIAYNSRYQAATVEEAIVAFRDVTLDEDLTDERINTNTLECTSLECQTCAALLAQRLHDIGFLHPSDSISLPIPNHVDPRHCQRFRFLMQHDIPQPPPPTENVRKLIENGNRYAGQHKFNKSEAESMAEVPEITDQIIWPAPENNFWSSVVPISTFPQSMRIPKGESPEMSFSAFQQQQLRKPRSTSIFKNKMYHQTHKKFNAKSSNDKRVKRESETSPVIGERHTISCVKRGEIDSSQLLTLCGSCWTWRKLPADYFPPIINELVCGSENDRYCLSGFGSCEQKYRTFDVLKKINNEWKPVAMSAASCCDCRVQAGTEIHALVVGSAKKKL